MPGVVSVQDHVGGALDQVLKGVAIARDIYGIKTEHDKAQIVQQQADQNQQKFEDEQAGIVSPKDRLEFGAKYAPAQEGDAGAMPLKYRGDDGSVLTSYVKARSEGPGQTHTIPNVKDPQGSGMIGSAITDMTGKIIGFVPQETTPKEPKDVKTREVKTIDPETGGEIIQIVEDKPGQTFKSPGPKDKGITKDQFAVAGFAKRMQQAESIFSDLSDKGFDRTSNQSGLASLSPINALKPDDLLAQEQAERNFVNATLRRESGAAISKEEFSDAEKQYFPRAGDTPEVLAQKKQNRDQQTASFTAEAGKAMKEIPDIALKKPGQKDTAGKAFAGQGDTAPNAALHPQAKSAAQWANDTLTNPKSSGSDRAKAAEILKRLELNDKPDAPMATQGSM